MPGCRQASMASLVSYFFLVKDDFQFRLATLLCATNASALRASTKPFKGSWDLSS